jgi:hypothetical protein
VQRHLPTLETDLDLVAGLRTLGAATGGLALRALTATDTGLRGVGAGTGRRWWTFSTPGRDTSASAFLAGAFFAAGFSAVFLAAGFAAAFFSVFFATSSVAFSAFSAISRSPQP